MIIMWLQLKLQQIKLYDVNQHGLMIFTWICLVTIKMIWAIGGIVHLVSNI